MEKYQQMGGNRNKFKSSGNTNDYNSEAEVTTVPISSEFVNSFTGPSTRPFGNSFAGSSRPRNEQQQRRRPKKQGNKYDDT